MKSVVPRWLAGVKTRQCHEWHTAGRPPDGTFWRSLVLILPCPCEISKAFAFGVSLIGLIVNAHCQSVFTWGVTSQGQSLSLAPGGQLYIYALGTDGAGPASTFSQGQTLSVGFSTAELGICTANSNSFSGRATFYGMEGVGVGGFNYAQGFYNYSLNNSNLTNSIQFTLSAPALAVVVGVGAGQESLAISGLNNLAFDVPPANAQYTAQVGETPALASTHVYLGPGTYTVEETTSELGSTPNPGMSAALLGLFIFSSQPNPASSGALPIPISRVSPSLNQGLVAWYPFFNGNANDASGHGNNAVSFGSPSYEPGPINYAAWLYGVDDYFSCPVNLNEFTNVTIAFWVKVLNYPADGRYQLVSNDNGNYGRVINLMGAANSEDGPLGSLQIFYDAAPGYIGFSQPLQPGTWYHVAGVWTPGATTLYLDGQAALSGPGPAESLSDLTNVLIGYPGPQGSTYSDYTCGCFNDVRIYNRALSPQEIQQLANQSGSPIPGLFNTGEDTNGNLLSGGSVDPHYILLSSADTNAPGPNSYAMNETVINAVYPGAYPDDAYSQWITPSSDTGSSAPGNYVYRTTFDLSGYDTNSVTVSGTWWMDDDGLDIRLNGNSTGNSYSPEETSLGSAFTITRGFINGSNTLDFVISNAECDSCLQGYNPTGLRVELSGAGALLSSESPPVKITNINVGPAGGGNLAMSIQGSGFGGNFAYNGTLPYLRITNVTEHWDAGFSGDGVGVNILSWTDTNILIGGFTGWLFNSPGYQLRSGDQLEVMAENYQTQGGLVTGNVTLSQGTLVIDIQPPSGHPMMLNNIELQNFENSLLSQLQRAGLCQANSTPVAVYIVTNPPSLSTDVELDLMCIAMDTPYSIYSSASDMFEVGFLGASGPAASDTLGTEAANALIPGSTSPVGTAFNVATTVPGYGASAQAYLFNQYGGAWTFTNGTTQVEPQGFCSVGTFGCNDHLRILIPLSSLPQSLDLRNVLGNLLYGVVTNGCGDYPPTAYLDEVGSSTNAQVTFGPIYEECYAAGGGQYGLPAFSAQMLDALGNPVPASILCPAGSPAFTINIANGVPGGGTSTGAGFAYSNSTVIVTATPDSSCFSFENWTVNGSYLTNSSTCAFIATSNENLTANFVTNFYSVTTSISPPGGGVVSGGITTNCGDSVTLIASNNPGYSFAGWNCIDDGATNWITNLSTFTFAVTANSNLVANFVPVGNSGITTIAWPPQGGSTTGAGTYTNGVSATISATAADCYAFEYWTTNGVPFSFSATDTITVETNEVFTANFAPISYNISLSASAGGTVNGGGSFNCGDTVTFYATPDPCYSFVNWSENGSPVSSSPDFYFMVDTNHNFVAKFARIRNIVATLSSPENGGSTSGGGGFGCDSNVTVTAEANSGYSFIDWTENGAFVSASSNYTFTAYGNQQLTANFIPIVPILGFASPPWSAGDWGIVLQGPVGSNYQLDFSTDFFNWFPATNFVSTGSPFYIIVPESTNDNSEFFRAKIQ